MGALHLSFGATITEISIFQTICLLSKMRCRTVNMIERHIKGGQKTFFGSFFPANFRRQYLENGLSDLLKN